MQVLRWQQQKYNEENRVVTRISGAEKSEVTNEFTLVMSRRLLMTRILSTLLRKKIIWPIAQKLFQMQGTCIQC